MDSTPVARPPVPPLDRRGFLRGSAGGLAAIGLASMLPAGCAADYPQAAADGVMLASLSEKEYAVARAAAEAILSGVPVEPHQVAAAIDAELAAVGEPVRSDMKSVLGLIEHLTFLGGQWRRFTALSPAARLENLRGWSRSRLNLRRGAYLALHGFVVYCAYNRDATRSLTGFPGPWPERLSIPAKPVDFGEVA